MSKTNGNGRALPKKRAKKPTKGQRALIVDTDSGPQPYDRLVGGNGTKGKDKPKSKEAPAPKLKIAEGTSTKKGSAADTMEDKVVALLTQTFMQWLDEAPDECEWMSQQSARTMNRVIDKAAESLPPIE
jgi:hypothetical protein